MKTIDDVFNSQDAYNINIFKTLAVGNEKVGVLFLVVHQKNNDKEDNSIALQLLVNKEVSDDIEKYKVAEGKYHVEFEDTMVDIEVLEDSILVGFSSGEYSTIQKINTKE